MAVKEETFKAVGRKRLGSGDNNEAGECAIMWACVMMESSQAEEAGVEESAADELILLQQIDGNKMKTLENWKATTKLDSWNKW